MNAPRIPPAFTPPDPLQRIGTGTISRTRRRLRGLELVSVAGPFLLVLKAFLIVALLGVLPRLGPAGHTLALLAFAALALASLIHARRRYRGISDTSARRAVERASGLMHRPLTALADTPATAPGLWKRYREHVALNLQKVHLSVPRPDWSRLDHRVLRLAGWAALALAGLLAWDDAPHRLRDAVHPPVQRLLPSATLDAWITPPAYTGQAPFALRADMADVSVPEGSTLQLRVSGGWFPPVAVLNGQASRLTQEAAHSFVLNRPLTAAGPLFIRQDGRLLGRWTLQLLVDTPPSVTFARPPAPTDQQALRIDYTAIDDMGLARIEAVIEPGALAADSRDSAPIVLELPVRTPPPLEASGFRYFDLTAHPWAGNDVIITLRATDVKGQSADSDPVATKLPARHFSNPIAKALIRLRRELVVRGAGAREDVMNALSQLAGEAEDRHAGDWTGALAMRVMVARLKFNDSPDIMPGMVQLMWDTALHFEDGGIDQALYHLRERQQALEDALSRGAEDPELQQLMSELDQAMQEYLDRLQQQMPQPDGEQQPDQPMEGQSITRDQLEQFLEQMRQMAQSGQRDQAMQMLHQLQQLMENLQGGGGDPEMRDRMRELGDITREQEELMNRTQRNEQGGMCNNPGGQGDSPSQGQSQGQGQQQGQQRQQMQPGQGQQQGNADPSGQRPDGDRGADDSAQGGSSQPGGDQLSQKLQDMMQGLQDGQDTGDDGMPTPGEQGQLADRLGRLLDQLEERELDTDTFRDGQKEMEGAEDALRQQQRDNAVRRQGEALNHLQQGLKDLQAQAARQQQSERDSNSDPLGRQRGGNGMNTGTIDIPDQQDTDRARAVLEELRRRAGDMRRPQEERDYLDRLLKWF